MEPISCKENPLKPHLALAHAYWRSQLRPGDCAIDATCGNGHDTLALASILSNHPDTLLIGLDVQTSALEQTRVLLQKALPQEHFSKVLLHRQCHSNIHLIPLPNPPKLIVYNLGYLPGGDKKITTRTETTLASLQKSCALLHWEGALSITCYPGHAEGKREEEAILAWAKSLSPERWQVCRHSWVNRPSSPSLFWIACTRKNNPQNRRSLSFATTSSG